MMTVASASSWMSNIPESGVVKSREPSKILVGINHISGTADRLRCCQLRYRTRAMW